jgi:hypothetical protein
MCSRNRSLLNLKTWMKVLFAITLFVPSAAFADWNFHPIQKVEVCRTNTPCEVLTGQAALDRAQGVNLPTGIEKYCDGLCTPTTPQYWWFEIGYNTWGYYYVANPAAGMHLDYSPPPVLSASCWQSGNATYKCRMGTGGPGWSWVMTTTYW